MHDNSWFGWFSAWDDYNTIAQTWEGDEGVRLYTADFETTTDLEDCRVWAFAICDVDDPDTIIYGTSIDRFFEVCKSLPNCRIYFHNLAFDASFMMDWMSRMTVKNIMPTRSSTVPIKKQSRILGEMGATVKHSSMTIHTIGITACSASIHFSDRFFLRLNRLSRPFNRM